MSQALWTAAGALGMAAMLGSIGAVGLMMPRKEETSDWRPSCVRQLGPAMQGLEVERNPATAPSGVYLLGVDRSPSNKDSAQAQLEAAASLARSLPITEGVGIFFVSDKSDHSDTPDLPFESGQDVPRYVSPPLPCEGDCRPASLFERQCRRQLLEATEQRRDQRNAEATALATTAHVERATRITAWSQSIADYWPSPGTSLLRFWYKIADLPVVRRGTRPITVVLWSDLEEARTTDARALRALHRGPQEGCPVDNPIPAGLEGIRVVLLQTRDDDLDADRWGRTWERGLRCRGAHVERYRYSPSIPLSEIFEPDDVAIHGGSPPSEGMGR